MYHVDMFCCICMNISDLKHLFEVDSDGVSHYNKLTSSIAEMNFKEMNDQRLICGKCCVTLNTVYNFRQMCLWSKTNLITYISQLLTSSHIKIKKEMEVKCEIEDIGYSFEDFSNSKCLLEIKSEPDEITALNKCCVCLRDQSGLKRMFEVDNHGMSHYNKLTSSIAEMNFKEMNDQSLICAECCVILNTVYNFRQMCLRSKTTTRHQPHISQLQTSDQTIRTVCLEVIKPELIVVKNRGGSDKESSNCLEGSNPQIEFQTEHSVDNIGFSASVKEECESGDDDSSAHEEATIDHEGVHSDVKVEDVEHQTMMEDYSECYADFNKIEIEEHQLSEVKDEPVSDTETTQDGSTSQANTRTSEEPKRSDAITIGTELTQNTEKYNEGLHQYEICWKNFYHNDSLTNHKQTHSSKLSYECEICNRGFNYKGNLTRHITTHSSERLFECQICKKGFNQKYKLTAHMKTHSSERLFECEICKKGFNQKYKLTAHMKTHSSERLFECGICNKGYNYKSYLDEHMNTHYNERPYECDICNKGFNQKSNLTLHMRTHSSVRQFECKICNKGFNYKCNLAEHIKTHSNERPYECDIFRKGFSNKNTLTTNTKIHTYECKICKKGFNNNTTLTTHMKIHTYECKICKKSFNYKICLVEHMKTHKRSNECKICKKNFSKTSNLTKHMELHGSKKII